MAVAFNAASSAWVGSAEAVTVRQAVYPSGRIRAAPVDARPQAVRKALGSYRSRVGADEYAILGECGVG
ncbi:hypothetical protein GTW93_25395 [Streptomyces sp. SID5789]|nr:hypothetical protein [Streptomyces sp. SID5789]MZE72262.1 hypothetical protein [Streptomyces sp. SID5789]